jgi:hypothetical protein
MTVLVLTREELTNTSTQQNLCSPNIGDSHCRYERKKSFTNTGFKEITHIKCDQVNHAGEMC